MNKEDDDIREFAIRRYEALGLGFGFADGSGTVLGMCAARASAPGSGEDSTGGYTFADFPDGSSRGDNESGDGDGSGYADGHADGRGDSDGSGESRKM